MKKILLKIFGIVILTSLIFQNALLLSINSMNLELNSDKKIILSYNGNQKELKLKKLKDQTYINKTFLGKKAEPKNAKVIIKNGEFIVKPSRNTEVIDIQNAQKNAIVKSSIELETKVQEPIFTTEKAEEFADILNEIKDQNLKIKISDEVIESNYKIQHLFKDNTNEVDLYALYSLLNSYDIKYSNLKSNLYVNLNEGTATGFIKNGKKINYTETSNKFFENIYNKKFQIDVEFEVDKGVVYDENGTKRDFRIQGEGKSNYKGSDWGRSQNVMLGTENLIKHVIVQPGEQVSFLKLLSERGRSIPWRLAKVIKNGGDLVLEPGGGLCQVSTTLFRGALQSGMKIDQWRNHSLYVSYYKEYNNGLDSTIYPPYVDLKFTNPYNFPIIFQSYTNENKDVIVEIYAEKNLPKVELIGPFFNDEIPTLGRNQIKWQRVISNPFGDQIEDYVSTYNTGVMR